MTMSFRSEQFHPRPFCSPFFHRRKVGTRTVGGFTVPQLVQIYGGLKIKRVTPTVPLIAIIELGGGYLQSDNVAAFAADGLPLPTIANYSNGATNTPGDDADGEVALDIQVAAKVYSVLTGEAANIGMIWCPNTDAAYISGTAKAGQIGAATFSSSWGAPESQWTSASMSGMGSAFAANIAAGCYNWAASGDSDSSDGAGGNNVDFPASHPLCFGCGGTSLMVSGGTYSEKVWNDGRGDGGGGGLSKVFAKPAYQPLVGNARGVPDVSACADPNTGYRIFLDGQLQIIGGTSAVAPFYAGLFAAFVAGGISTQNLAARLYAAIADFQDITVGNNNGFQAAPGYDECTGLGTPKIATLFGALGGVPPPVVVPPPVTTPPVVSSSTFTAVITPAVTSLVINGVSVPVPPH